MAFYVGLAVSVKETSICIMDDKGVVAARTDISTAPDLIAGFISKHPPKVERVVHESGILAIWLKMLEQTTNHTRHGSNCFQHNSAVAIAVGKELVGENAHEFNQTQGYTIPEILRRVMMKIFSG
jgi:hypothetical protein